MLRAIESNSCGKWGEICAYLVLDIAIGGAICVVYRKYVIYEYRVT